MKKKRNAVAKRKTSKQNTKFIFVSGGVISGLGKGITAASIAAILKSKGYTVSPVKVDMYLNYDAGTIRPQEHGEVFVTDDGLESDQDLGHYERFLDTDLTRANYMTTGQVYSEVLRKERAFEYNGEDVEAIPHVTDEIIRRFKLAGKKADFVIVELGGTVGEYQNAIFFEASRIMKLRNPRDVIQIHVAYLPIPGNLGEMKSKPVQQSVRTLNSMGIEPDFIIARAEHPVDDRRKERIALFCNVKKEDVISNPDMSSIYEVPLVLQSQKLGENPGQVWHARRAERPGCLEKSGTHDENREERSPYWRGRQVFCHWQLQPVRRLCLNYRSFKARFLVQQSKAGPSLV
jgi:CTP synthase